MHQRFVDGRDGKRTHSHREIAIGNHASGPAWFAG
jgi:hypothetical protein